MKIFEIPSAQLYACPKIHNHNRLAGHTLSAAIHRISHLVLSATRAQPPSPFRSSTRWIKNVVALHGSRRKDCRRIGQAVVEKPCCSAPPGPRPLRPRRRRVSLAFHSGQAYNRSGGREGGADVVKSQDPSHASSSRWSRDGRAAASRCL